MQENHLSMSSRFNNLFEACLIATPDALQVNTPLTSRYQTSLLRLLAAGGEHVVANSNSSAIADWYELLFSISRQSIRLFSPDFKANYFNTKRVVRAARLAVQHGVQIMVVYHEQESSELFDLLESNSVTAQSANPVTIQKATERVFERTREFSISDSQACRLTNVDDPAEGSVVLRDQSVILPLIAFFEELVIPVERTMA